MKFNIKRVNKSPVPPSTFEQDQKFMWDNIPAWRDRYIKDYLHIRKTLLLTVIKINILPFVASLLIALLLQYFTEVSISINLLHSLSMGFLNAIGAIMAIIFTFLIFWFGNADSMLRNARDLIKSRIGDLDIIREKIRIYTSGPKDSVQGEIREKTEELATASNKFSDALHAIIGRYSRASFGTYYDEISVFKLESLIHHTGGEFWVSFCGLINNRPDQEDAKCLWLDTSAMVRQISEKNTEIITATNQIKRILNFTPILASLLFIFLLSLVVALISDTNTSYILMPFPRLVFSTILVIMLLFHLINIFRILFVFMSSRHVSYEISRANDVQASAQFEKSLGLNYSDALKSQAEATIQVLKKFSPSPPSNSNKT